MFLFLTGWILKGMDIFLSQQMVIIVMSTYKLLLSLCRHTNYHKCYYGNVDIKFKLNVVIVIKEYSLWQWYNKHITCYDCPVLSSNDFFQKGTQFIYLRWCWWVSQIVIIDKKTCHDRNVDIGIGIVVISILQMVIIEIPTKRLFLSY